MARSIWHIIDTQKCELVFWGGGELPSCRNVGRMESTLKGSLIWKRFFFPFSLPVPFQWVPLCIPLLLPPRRPWQEEYSFCTFCDNPRSPVKHTRRANSKSSLLFPAGLSSICHFLLRARFLLLLPKGKLCVKRGGQWKKPGRAACFPPALVDFCSG